MSHSSIDTIGNGSDRWSIVSVSGVCCARGADNTRWMTEGKYTTDGGHDFPLHLNRVEELKAE
jgi:hypothetical protein